MAVNVLVVFYSRYGASEKLALTAGVGAIQARANIRLRRLADLADPETVQRDTAWLENLERMKKDYIAPREVDAQWADVLILAAPGDCLAEMTRYLESARGILEGKLAAVLGPFADEAAHSGLKVAPADEDVCGYGRRTALLAQALKEGRAAK
jgi:NAD(P)H dehydrogenase (quinone)